MGKLFGGGAGAMPDKTRPVRMPTEQDPTILAAAERAKRAAQGRRGRQGTILTDQLSGVVGSSGQRLGA